VIDNFSKEQYIYILEQQAQSKATIRQSDMDSEGSFRGADTTNFRDDSYDTQMNKKIRPRTAGPNNIIEDHRAALKKMATTGQNFMKDVKAKTIAEDDEGSDR
jgi:hypothetical protein